MARSRAAKKAYVPSFEFGDRVRKARHHAGLTATDLSLKLGMSKTAVTYWEHGGRPADLVETAQRIAQVTGVDFLWLLTGDSETRGCLVESTSDLRLSTQTQLPSAS